MKPTTPKPVTSHSVVVKVLIAWSGVEKLLIKLKGCCAGVLVEDWGHDAIAGGAGEYIMVFGCPKTSRGGTLGDGGRPKVPKSGVACASDDVKRRP